MKMTKDDFLKLESQITEVLRDYPEAQQAYANAGLSAMRFRWDCFAKAKVDHRPLYEYLDNTHIDTALRNIVKSHNKQT